jgi:DNA adenine methylase
VSHYIEPFLGGGAVYGHLKSKQPSLSATLVDVNAELIGVYSAIKNDTENFLAEIAKLESAYKDKPKDVRKSDYYALRKSYWQQPTPAKLYFLMKTGFNGIWQTCKESNGLFGTPAGLLNHKGPVVDVTVVRAWAAAMKSGNTQLIAGDYSSTQPTPKSFIYCDPPYRDSFTSYGTGFNDTDHLKLISWCRKQHLDSDSEVWLANRDAGDLFFETHAPDATIYKFPIVYTAGRRRKTDNGFEAKAATEILLVWKR